MTDTRMVLDWTIVQGPSKDMPAPAPIGTAPQDAYILITKDARFHMAYVYAGSTPAQPTWYSVFYSGKGSASFVDNDKVVAWAKAKLPADVVKAILTADKRNDGKRLSWLF